MSKPFSWEADINDVRRNLIREMNRAGAVRLEGAYSGGHDSGGCDTFRIYNKDGDEIEVPSPLYDSPLYSCVNELLSTKFYSWATEYYASGKVYVDLNEKRAWTEGDVEVTKWQNDGDPIDMRW